jgi:putative ABC transport system permease protein
MTIRLVFRSLFRSPAYAATSIGTIALTIALAATVFAIVDGVLFKPLPYRNGEQLFRLMGSDGGPGSNGGSASVSAIDIKYLSEADPRIRITAIGMGSSFTNPDRPDLTFWTGAIDSAFFDVLGQYPLVGGFTPDDFALAAVDGAPTPSIVTHGFWRQWLGADPAVVGRSVEFGTRTFVIRGVLPRDFVYPSARGPAVLVPLVVPAKMAANRWDRIFTGIVRLEGGVSRAEARARLDAALASRIAEYSPRQVLPGPYNSVRMRPLAATLKENERELFSVAFAVAGLLVVLGAINVAGLFGARSRDRQRELSIRAALGASRSSLVAALLAESMYIALIGAAVGIAVAQPLIAGALSLLPETFTLLKDPSIDARVVAFAIVAAIVPVVLCALFPAVSAMSAAVVQRLAGSTTTATPRARGWGRSALLGIESALGIVLVVIGALILTSFVLLRGEDAGFDADQLAVVELIVPGTRSIEELDARRTRAFDRMKILPGVRGAATFDAPLLRRMFAGSEFSRPDGGTPFFASDIPVSDTFFEVAGLRLLDGRFPTASEIAQQQRVAVVSEETASAYWPGRSGVGEILESPLRGAVTVVGVVEEARFGSQGDAHGGEIYIPQLRPAPHRVYLLKTAGDPADVIHDLAIILRRDVPGVLVRRAVSFDQALADSVRDHRARMVIFTLTAGAAMILLVVGIVGIVASGVARRVREIGIRSALGAQQPQLVRMIVVGYLRPIVAGVGCGLVASWWAAQLVKAFVYQIDAHDPVVFGVAAVTLVVAATVAAWIPARRASAVDPVTVLRAD